MSAAEDKAKEVERLEAELAELKSEREETANRISELEIDVLEAKEAVEKAEDAKAKAESRTKRLEDELAKAKVASEGALEDKERSLLAQLDAAREEREARAAELQEEQDKLLSQLATLEGELANARAALEEASKGQRLVAEEHAAKMQSLEQSNQVALDDLNAELEKIGSELKVIEWLCCRLISADQWLRDRRKSSLPRSRLFRKNTNNGCKKRSRTLT